MVFHGWRMDSGSYLEFHVVLKPQEKWGLIEINLIPVSIVY